MRRHEFEISGSTYIVSEGEDLRVNGRAVTAWEVRKVCFDEFGHEYLHQYAGTYIPRRATIAQIKAHIARVYVEPTNDDEDIYDAA